MAVRLDDLESNDGVLQIHVPNELKAEYDKLRDRFREARKDFNKAVKGMVRDFIAEANKALDAVEKKSKPQTQKPIVLNGAA